MGRQQSALLCSALPSCMMLGTDHTLILSRKSFDTNHEQITIDIILSEETEVNRILRKVSSTFPQEVASVIQKTHPNPQVVQLISEPNRCGPYRTTYFVTLISQG